jgi:glycogen synthase
MDERLWWLALGAVMTNSPKGKELLAALETVDTTHAVGMVWIGLKKNDKALVQQTLGLPLEDQPILQQIIEKLQSQTAAKRISKAMQEMDFAKGLPPTEYVKWLRDKANLIEDAIK